MSVESKKAFIFRLGALVMGFGIELPALAAGFMHK